MSGFALPPLTGSATAPRFTSRVPLPPRASTAAASTAAPLPAVREKYYESLRLRAKVSALAAEAARAAVLLDEHRQREAAAAQEHSQRVGLLWALQRARAEIERREDCAAESVRAAQRRRFARAVSERKARGLVLHLECAARTDLWAHAADALMDAAAHSACKACEARRNDIAERRGDAEALVALAHNVRARERAIAAQSFRPAPPRNLSDLSNIFNISNISDISSICDISHNSYLSTARLVDFAGVAAEERRGRVVLRCAEQLERLAAAAAQCRAHIVCGAEPAARTDLWALHDFAARPGALAAVVALQRWWRMGRRVPFAARRRRLVRRDCAERRRRRTAAQWREVARRMEAQGSRRAALDVAQASAALERAAALCQRHTLAEYARTLLSRAAALHEAEAHRYARGAFVARRDDGTAFRAPPQPLLRPPHRLFARVCDTQPYSEWRRNRWAEGAAALVRVEAVCSAEEENARREIERTEAQEADGALRPFAAAIEKGTHACRALYTARLAHSAAETIARALIAAEEADARSTTITMQQQSITLWAQRNEPKTLIQSDQPEAVEQSDQPEAVVQSDQPEAVEQSDQPEAVVQSDQPEAVVQSDQPEAVEQSDQPEAVEQSDQPEAVVQSDQPEAVVQSDQPEAVEQSDQPEALVQSDQPEAVEQSDQPEAVEQSDQPEAVEQSDQPEALVQSDQPEAVEQSDQPEAVEQSDQPEAVEQSDQPEAVEQSDQPEALVQSDQPEAVVQSDQPEAVEQSDQPEAVVQSDQPEAVEQSDQPEAVVQSDQPEAVEQSDQPEAVEQSDQPEAVEQSDQPEAVEQSDQPEAVEQSDQPEAVEQSDQPEALVQSDQPEAVVQSDQPEALVQSDQPEAVEQSDQPEALVQSDQPEAVVQSDQPEAVEQSDQPEAVVQSDQPEAVVQSDQPEAVEQSDQPEAVVQSDQPEAVEQSDQPEAVVQSDQPEAVEQSDQPEAVVQSDQPEAVEQSDQPEAVVQSDQPEAVEQSDQPEAVVQSDQPEAVEQSDQPEAVVQSDQPEAVVQSDQPEAVVQSDQPEAVVQSDQPEAVEQSDQPEAVVQSDQPEAVVQSDQPEAVVQSDQPEAVEQSDQPEAVEQSDQPEAVEQSDQPEALVQSDQPEAVVQSDQPEAVVQSDQPEAVVQSDQPEAVEQSDQPEAVVQSDQPEAVEQNDQPEAVVQSDQPEAVEQSDQPEAVVQSDQPEAVEQSDQPEAVKQSDQPEAVEQSDQPEALVQSDQPEAVVQSDQPEALAVKNSRHVAVSVALEALLLRVRSVPSPFGVDQSLAPPPLLSNAAPFGEWFDGRAAAMTTRDYPEIYERYAAANGALIDRMRWLLRVVRAGRERIAGEEAVERAKLRLRCCAVAIAANIIASQETRGRAAVEVAESDGRRPLADRCAITASLAQCAPADPPLSLCLRRGPRAPRGVGLRPKGPEVDRLIGREDIVRTRIGLDERRGLGALLLAAHAAGREFIFRAEQRAAAVAIAQFDEESPMFPPIARLAQLAADEAEARAEVQRVTWHSYWAPLLRGCVMFAEKTLTLQMLRACAGLASEARHFDRHVAELIVQRVAHLNNKPVELIKAESCARARLEHIEEVHWQLLCCH